MKKHDALQLLHDLPEEFEIDELMYRLELLKKLEASETASREGRVLTHEEAVRRSQTWFK